MHSRRLGAAQAQPIILKSNLHWIAHRREAEDFDHFAFEQPHFEDALDDRIVAIDGIDAGALAGAELIERNHGLTRDGADEDLKQMIAAESESRFANHEDAGGPRLQDAQPAAGANS